jgi:Na+-translocating ferredoxin:NAD+ oxidoreductase RnfE subunit
MTSENMTKSLFRTVPVIIIGIGLIAPLLAHLSFLRSTAVGGIAVVSLLIITSIIALFGARIPHNARTSLAVILTSGIITLAFLAVMPFHKGHRLPLETLAPLLITVALISLHTEAYNVKKRMQPILFDASGIGLSFTVLLCLCGFVRDALGKGLLGTKTVLPPVAFFLTPSGIFLIVAVMLAIFSLIAKKNKRTAP